MNVFCLFEQSSIFKEELKKLGYITYDIDIENTYGKTNIQLDLFEQINDYFYNFNINNVFTHIYEWDLVFAFFPCTYFSTQSNLIINKKSYSMRNWDNEKINIYVEERKKKRDFYLEMLRKLIMIAKDRGFYMIIENPYHLNYLLSIDEFKNPDVIIKNRRLYGDIHKKPTMFYYYNFKPTYFSNEGYYLGNINNCNYKTIVNIKNPIERSLMTSEFAYNFIHKYVFGYPVRKKNCSRYILR